MFSSPKKQPTPEELIKHSRKQISRSQRDIEKEIRSLERQEKTIALEIKKLAAKGKDILLCRNYWMTYDD
jgi:predicted nuclease of restriction endonuclease-like RecB superfamily